jgi:hypothetical protein
MRGGCAAAIGAQYAAGGGGITVRNTIRKSVITVLGLSMPACASPISDDFAIKCVGTAKSSDKYVRNGEVRTTNLGEQVYVIRVKERVVYRALFPRQEFDPVCGSGGKDSPAYISPGLITLSDTESEDGFTTTCSMEIDRKSGNAKHVLKLEKLNGWFNQQEWDMTCMPTDIPVFDTSGNKF